MALLLTIITVNLNNKNGLERTLESVFQQSFTYYEIIIIDGGSVDGSAELLVKHAQRFKYCTSELDNGIYHAMNKGVRQASGEYCLFLNSGDWLINEHVLQDVFSRTHGADILTGSCNISKSGSVVFVSHPGDKLTLKSFVRNTLPHQATFIKRILFDKFGLYNEQYRLHADYDFWIRSIIIGQCSVEKMNIVVSNYNMEGLSSDVENNPHIHQEAIDILHGYFPKTILDDYYTWLEETKDDAVILKWAKSKPIIYVAIKYLYKISKRLHCS